MNPWGRTVVGLALGAGLFLAACGGSATEAYDGTEAPVGDLSAVPKPGDGEEGVRSATAYVSFQGARAAALQKLFVELQDGGRFVDIELSAGPQRAAPRALADVDDTVRFVIIPSAPANATRYEHTGGALPARDLERGYFLQLTVKHFELVADAPVERTAHYGYFTENPGARAGIGGDLYRLH